MRDGGAARSSARLEQALAGQLLATLPGSGSFGCHRLCPSCKLIAKIMRALMRTEPARVGPDQLAPLASKLLS